MRKNVRFQLTSSLAVAAMETIMSPTGFGIADLWDDDSGSWGDPVED
jgi:hypothetical protein